jgi:hypothetical protein
MYLHESVIHCVLADSFRPAVPSVPVFDLEGFIRSSGVANIYPTTMHIAILTSPRLNSRNYHSKPVLRASISCPTSATMNRT